MLFSIGSAFSWGWFFALIGCFRCRNFWSVPGSKPYYKCSGSRSAGFFISVSLLRACLLLAGPVWLFPIPCISIPTLQDSISAAVRFLPASFGCCVCRHDSVSSAAIAETVSRRACNPLIGSVWGGGLPLFFACSVICVWFWFPQQSVPYSSDDQFLVAATKDSSLAVAIGFPELVSVFIGRPRLNQPGRRSKLSSGHGVLYISSACWSLTCSTKYNGQCAIKCDKMENDLNVNKNPCFWSNS